MISSARNANLFRHPIHNTAAPEDDHLGNINFRRNYSRGTLFRMLILALVVAGVFFWKWDLINDVYFKDQLTQLGWTINGAIVVLFAAGLLRMVITLFSYMREENALVRFIRNMETRPDVDPLKGVGGSTLIAQRYNTLRALHETHTPVNQNALASTLVASESTRNSMPKFINNTLILTGVFGTIVSLSIALVGASDVLEDAVNTAGMGMVIHGMSTALSTTITAIICYMYFGYFYLRVSDAQTNLISGIEQFTTVKLLPKYQVQTDSVLYEFTGLIRSLQGLVVDMRDSQKSFQEAEQQIAMTLEYYRDKIDGLDEHMAVIIRHLRLGFRLRDNE